MYAITPKGIGKKVGARNIEPDWPLISGEEFKIDLYHPNMVLASDGISLRELTQIEIDTLQAIQDAKNARDAALDALVHDFGDGRIIQVRPQDESNIRNAIEVINNEPLIDTINWRMVDNTISPVTSADLQAALNSGQLQALAIWDAYNGA